jgi:hypothetical protein
VSVCLSESDVNRQQLSNGATWMAGSHANACGTRRPNKIVMAGLVPAIHESRVARSENKDVDGPNKSGHDEVYPKAFARVVL